MDCTPLSDETVTLEPASAATIGLLVQWTLDPAAQGPYKRVPRISAAELRDLFLHSPDRCYFLIRRTPDGKPLGRFYYRAWRFDANEMLVDWELNILIAEPSERGKGFGTAAQRLAVAQLLDQPGTHSVFAYTLEANHAERRSLLKAGFQEIGPLPSAYYRVTLPPQPCILYVQTRTPEQPGHV